MWKSVIAMSWLVLRIISSEPVLNENVRTSRQLNFVDCCPCPPGEHDQDQSAVQSRIVAATSPGDDDCPCRSILDSEAAPSVFRPMFRAREPFVKSNSKKGDAEPLLKPEVGLASSVLETLQEVTDQEYQEALARDAARSVQKIMDPDLPETEPNVVNIILQPKEDGEDDFISEASQVKETTYIHPPTMAGENFEKLRLKPPVQFLKHIFSSPKTTSNSVLHKNRFDMDGSASNVQEKALQPLKTNVLEDIKARSNLLKLRLFPSSENLLRESSARNVNQVGDNSYGKVLNTINPKANENNLSPMVDYLKNSVPKYDGPNGEVQNKDYFLLPSALQKQYIKNNIRDRMLSKNHKPLLRYADEQPNITNNLRSHMTKNTNDNIFEGTACTESLKKPEVSVPIKENIELDVVSSSTNLIEDRNLEGIIEKNNILGINGENGTYSEKILNTDMGIGNFIPVNNNPITEVSDHIELTTEGIMENSFNLNKHNVNIDSNFKNVHDIKAESSIPRSTFTKLDDAVIQDCTSSYKDEQIVDKSYLNNSEDPNHQELTSEDSGIINMKSTTLPNIKEDILKTLENFKVANEKIQEKLRSNVQDALKVIKKVDSHDKLRFVDKEPSETLRNNLSDTELKNSVSTNDLQKMSDSLLEISSTKEKPESSLIKNVENKHTEIDKTAADIDDVFDLKMISNQKNSSISSVESKQNSNLKNPVDDTTDKIEENVCNNDIMLKNSDSSDAKNEDNEMIAESSNSIYKGISPLNNLRPIIGSDVFDDAEKGYNINPYVNNNGNGDPRFFANQPLFIFNQDETIDSPIGFTRADIPQLNSNFNLHTAKVPSPEFLYRNSVTPNLPFSQEEPDVYGFASQRIPSVNFLRNPADITISKTLGKNNAQNSLGSHLQTPKKLQDILSSASPHISENLKPENYNGVKTLRDSIDMVLGKPSTIINKSKLLEKSYINPENLYGSVLKTREDFHNKLQALHSGLNRKLSSMSSRITPEDSRLLANRRLNNLKNKADLINDSVSPILRKPTLNPWLLSRNRENIELNTRKPILTAIRKISTNTARKSNKPDLRSNLKQKVGIVPHQLKPFEKRPIQVNSLKEPLPFTKQSLKNNIKLNPQKENKAAISFTTTSTRPDTLKSGLLSLLQTGARNSLNNLPKISKLPKSFTPKKSNMKSILENNEPKVSASEHIISKAAFPNMNLGKELKMNQKLPYLDDIGNIKRDDKHSLEIKEANKAKTLMLPKTKDSVVGNGRIINKYTVINDKAFDAIPAASDNIDRSTTSLVEQTLKEKMLYKCKMVCVKDTSEVTDT